MVAARSGGDSSTADGGGSRQQGLAPVFGFRDQRTLIRPFVDGGQRHVQRCVRRVTSSLLETVTNRWAVGSRSMTVDRLFQ
jgi:hypothetical protein